MGRINWRIDTPSLFPRTTVLAPVASARLGDRGFPRAIERALGNAKDFLCLFEIMLFVSGAGAAISHLVNQPDSALGLRSHRRRFFFCSQQLRTPGLERSLFDLGIQAPILRQRSIAEVF